MPNLKSDDIYQEIIHGLFNPSRILTHNRTKFIDSCTVLKLSYFPKYYCGWQKPTLTISENQKDETMHGTTRIVIIVLTIIIYYVRTRLVNFSETRKLKSSRPVKQPRDFNNG